MESEWIDISAGLHDQMATWPGDPSFVRRVISSMRGGDESNFSMFTGSVHIGTHMDAPFHFVDGGDTIDAIPLSASIGPARVIQAGSDGVAIRAEELQAHNIRPGERILLRTRNSDLDWPNMQFLTDYVYITPDAARYLVECGVQAVGIDYLSVGAMDESGVETHRILLSAGVCVIEGLNLRKISPGDYEMICLPIKLRGSDGAPARAVLRPAQP